MSITETAKAFFDAIEAGQNWDDFKMHCHDGATFSCQADALADVKTLEEYAGWMKGLFTPIPDMHPDIQSVATDQERSIVIVQSVVHGKHTGRHSAARRIVAAYNEQ